MLLRQFHTLSPLSPSCPTSAFPMLRYRAQGGKWRVSLKPVVSCSEAKGPSTQALGQQVCPHTTHTSHPITLRHVGRVYD